MKMILAYRTILTAASAALPGILPIALLAAKRKELLGTESTAISADCYPADHVDGMAAAMRKQLEKKMNLHAHPKRRTMTEKKIRMSSHTSYDAQDTVFVYAAWICLRNRL